MSDPSVPVPAQGAVAMQSANPREVDWRVRLSEFAQQPAFRRALPALVGVGVIAVLAALYMMIAQGPQRILYSTLSDGERAKVVEALERGGIGYSIDNSTGTLTVGENDLYRARMLVASDAGLAAPEGASEMLDAIPIGSSRTLEGERLRLARERELMLTIREIDGIDSVRVHLATPERSVFVRQSNPPSASVMVRLVSGRTLSQAQVEAIVNLVSGSVPGMTTDAVRVVDQNGRLLSSDQTGPLDSLVLQREFEGKLREQVTSLLMPLLGDGNFSSQVQVQLDQSEMTSARESYDRDGAIRSESERLSTRTSASAVGGIPGVTANTPPPDAQLADGPPDPQNAAQQQAGAAQTLPTDSESATQRNYELGREVAVTSTRPGGLMRLSVAVAVDNAALEAASPLTSDEIASLVSAAVGADEARGDKVQVVVSAFESVELAPLAFYEQGWFGDLLRYATALIAVLLVLLLAVRPLIAWLRGPVAQSGSKAGEPGALEGPEAELALQAAERASDANAASEDDVPLPDKVELARQLAVSEPDRAAEALRRMLETPSEPLQPASAS